MALAPGVRLGAYEILALIGAGGMGEVYRARDARLGRDVAIKILPDAFIHDGDRLARFKREAQVLASLNHPNIAAIYGLEESPAGNALVLELVDGPTLADRVAQGALSLEETLPIAKQIAEALEAAHELGIIHRDLKPANIKVTFDGKVKVLDFGLAKAVHGAAEAAPYASDAVGRDFSRAGAGSEKQDPAYMLSQSPTITSPAMTMGGVILGTAAYMSPEQAKGKLVDKRSDIWAFGCVLYEMLTGRMAFKGDDVSDTMAAVLRADPDWGAVPANVPPQIRRLLRRCLTKDPRERLHDMGDARLDIIESLNAPAESIAIKPKSRLHPALAAVVTLAAIAAAGLAAYAVWIVRQQASYAPESRFEIAVPQRAVFFAISPDGRYVAYAAPGPGGRAQVLWLRPINSLDVRMLQGTEGAAAPFWSPDSRSIAFFVIGESLLKRVDVSGDSAPILVMNFRAVPGTISGGGVPGGAWNRDGTIITGGTGGIRRFSQSGADLTRITEWDESFQETAHGFPSFLPDGRHFLYRALSAKPENQAIYVASLDSKVRKRLLTVESGTPAIYASPGFIVFLRGTTLMARPFDAERLEFSGDARTLAEGVLGAASVSENGTLVYRRHGREESNRQLLWMDRTGKRQAIDVQLAGDSTPRSSRDDISTLRLSPEGNRVAFAEMAVGDRSDISVYSIDRSMKTGLTNDASIDAFPIWSPDGSKLIFASDRTERMWALYEASAAGPTRERVVLPGESGKRVVALDWSRDGNVVLFTKEDAGRPGPAIQRDIWALPMTGDQKPTPYLQTTFDEGQATLSPSGRWVAYTSNEKGPYHVMVRSFPDATKEMFQISTNGGTWPRWSRDGQFLYYVDADGRLMAVAVKQESAFQYATATHLFDFPLPPATMATPNLPYDVAADGRFLVSAPATTDERASMAVILNWTASLSR